MAFVSTTPLWDLNFSSYVYEDSDYEYLPQDRLEKIEGQLDIANVVVAGIGIILNLIAAGIITVDIARDPQIRYWARSWLLVNLSFVHIVFLVMDIIIKMTNLTDLQTGSHCNLFLHFAYVVDMWVALSFALVALHVFLHVYVPVSLIGSLQMIFWGVMVALIGILAHCLTYFIHTIHTKAVQLGAHKYCISHENPSQETYELSFVIQFVVPNSISLLAAVLAIFGTFALKGRVLAGQGSRPQAIAAAMVIKLWERPAAVFVAIAVLFAWMTRLPLQVFHLKFALGATRYDIRLMYVGQLINTISVAIFPLLYLILVEIRGIWDKHSSNNNSHLNVTATEESQKTETSPDNAAVELSNLD